MKKTAYIAAAAMLAGISATAQTLNKEIVIDREIEPAERPVTRPATLSPDVYSTPLPRISLTPWDYTRTDAVRRQTTTLEPAQYADTFALSPYRGYARLGYLPAFNLGASLGYRLINKADTKLNGWLQYDGNSYDMKSSHTLSDPKPGDKVRLSQNTFTAALDLSHRFTAGTLNADGHFTYGSVGQPVYADGFNQTVTDYGLNLGWTAAKSRLPWHAGFAVGAFGFDNRTENFDALAGITHHYTVDGATDSKPAKAQHETLFSVSGGLELPIGNHAWALDLSADFQHRNALTGLFPASLLAGNDVPLESVAMMTDKGNTLGIVRLNPYYRLDRGKFTARLGANLDISINGNDGFTINPNAWLAFNPSQQVSLWARGTGGRVLNTLSSLFDYCPWMPSLLTHDQSTVMDVTAGINVGPVAGLTARLWGGYAKADDWQAPARLNNMNLFTSYNTNAWHFGLAIDYQWKQFVKASISAEGAESSGLHSYYMWRDAAKWNVTAALTVTPISKLDVTAKWNWRSGRHGYQLTPQQFGQDEWAYYLWSADRYSLGKVNSLSVSAQYRLTDALTITAQVDNITACRWQLVPGIDCAPIHGLVGAALKF